MKGSNRFDRLDETMKYRTSQVISTTAALLFGILGIWGAFQFQHAWDQVRRHEQRTAQLRLADDTASDQAAVALYKQLVPLDAAVQLRILQRQWVMALDLLDRIRLSKYHNALDKDLPLLYGSLDALLSEAGERAESVLAESAALPDRYAWRVHNLKAAVTLLKAFVALETEDNWKKVHALLKEAVNELKLAIERVDRLSVPMADKYIPRWNLELLQGRQDIRKILISTPETERRLDLGQSLEAIIPEKGGYAPGNPVERRMKK